MKLCKKKLEPLGIEVKEIFNDSELPFEDNTFDMIINRHSSFYIKEIKRILKPNGIFITQQVGGKNNEKLSNALIKDFKPLFSENTLDNGNTSNSTLSETQKSDLNNNLDSVLSSLDSTLNSLDNIDEQTLNEIN